MTSNVPYPLKRIKSLLPLNCIWLFLSILFLIPVRGNSQTSSDLTISVNPDDTSSWTIDKHIYGKFIEHNGRDAYPGLYAQHLANSSFEQWYHLGDRVWKVRTAVLYRNTETYGGLAYPWEPHYDDSSSKGHLSGGIHGERYQRIQVSDGKPGGIRQRTAIPDQRTQTFNLHVYVRGTLDSVKIQLEDGVGEPVDTETLPLTSDWTKHVVQFNIENITTSRYSGSPFGQYGVGILVEGDGYVDLDGLRLMSGDAVRDKYNPTTIELLKEYNVTSIRWPGGNWASAYHWQDGVGPLTDRPVRRNLAWGGLEPNFMGTNEFLEFCEIAGITPYLNVGFNQEIGPREAADWVEYVNGSTDTPMGQLRAEHGHPEPYNVKHWQVGNEVYGDYQIGHTDAEDFAQRFVNYYDAMKAVDSSITVIAAGIDPLYVDWDNTWNKTLFDIAGNKVDGVDIHRYVRGIVLDSKRADWSEDVYLRNMVAFPTQYQRHVLQEVRQSARNRGVSGSVINVGEWNLQAKVNRGWPRPNYPTMAHASFVAGMFNTFIKEGEAVRYSFQRDNTLFYRPYPIDMRPVNPGNYVSKYYAHPFNADNTYHQVDITHTSETFFMENAGIRQKDTHNVPYVDAAAMRSTDKSKLFVFVTNRNLNSSYNTTIELHQDWKTTKPVSVVTLHSSDPFNRQTSWTSRNGFSIDSTEVTLDNSNQLMLSLSSASVSRLEFDVEDTATSIAGGNPDLPGKVTLQSNYPNPFNPSTTIPYALPEGDFVKLEIFNTMGQRVATLVDKYQRAGRYKVDWNARDKASGVYYYKLTVGDVTRIKGMTLVK